MISKIIKAVVLSSILVVFVEANETIENDKYFLGVSTGLTYTSSDYVTKIGSFTNVTNPDKSGFNLALELGYNYNKSTFSTLSYSYIEVSDAKVHNYLLSYNYRFKDIPYNIYVGAVAGMSYLKLTKSPVANLTITDELGGEFAIGFQTGFEYPIKKDLNFFAQYQYLKAEHKTDIISGSAKAETIRDNFSNLSFGVRWKFNSIIPK